ncbi:MAG TPA: tyrosine-type recombinase/integrase, partial [Gemmatimonadota bacterium]|nr:tyrosine-type recombinase/integrase [Gemmatimonadota bacterium]
MEESAQRFYTERFEDYLRFERGLSTTTAAAYSADISQVVAFLEEKGLDTPQNVELTQLREFIYELKATGRAPASIRRKISALRSYFGFLQAEGLIGRDPSELLEGPKTGRTLPTVLTEAEVTALLEAPEGNGPLALRDRALLEFMYATGVRISELVNLRIRDLDMEERLVRVQGKGSKERIVPFGEVARAALDAYLREGRVSLTAKVKGSATGHLF